MVKGTNTASSVTVVDASGKEHTVELDAAEGYNDATYSMVVVDNLSGIATTTQNNKTVLNIKIRIKSEKNQATEIYIDDARLEEVPVVVDPNLIIDGGFETPTPEGAPTDILLKTGSNSQTNSLSDTNGYWAHSSWAKADVTKTRTIDSHSGNYALRFDLLTQLNSTANECFYVRPNNVSSDKFETGTYTFSCWVKGDRINKGAYIAFGDSKAYIPSAAANGWVKISVENIKLSSIDDLGYAGSTSGGDNVTRYSNLQFVFSHTTSEASGTYLIVDDFRLEMIEENCEKLLNTSFEEFTDNDPSYTDLKRGQTNLFATNWYGCEHWITGDNDPTKVVVSHPTDAHSGTYSLKFTMPANCPSFRVITNEINGNVTELSGAYTLSFWVKGNNPGLKLYERYYDSTQSKNVNVELKTFTVTSEWTQVTCLIPDIKYYTHNYSNNSTANNKDTLGLFIWMKGTSNDSEIYIDDISLMPADTIDDVKGQITGIKQPAVGATELELPVLDTNNDAITVSIAASSDEKVIALDGTITTPKTKKVVDITLKVTDGTNEVILDPIGVLVQGELDGVTEGEMAEAIRGLDVKAETAAADIEQIEYWLEYRGGMVTKDNKNLFAQKKLVFEFDIVGEDSVLDKDDIVAVREELLGENTKDYTIRDLVKTFNKVVEYNSFAQ